LSWALTFHKSQGITAEEGCVVSFDGTHSATTVSKLGLAFVAWTRATRWEKMAFHKLPLLEHFVAARLTREFVSRGAFESNADHHAAKFFQRRGVSVESLVEAHQGHFTEAMDANEGREASKAELADLRTMLLTEGVAPVSPSIVNYSKEHAGQKNSGLWSFVASFRAQQQKKKAPGSASAAPKQKPRQRPSSNPEDGAAETEASAMAEESARQSMVDMGFSLVDITMALERSDFQFREALLLLLNGLDQHRTKFDRDQSDRFRRHTVKKTLTPKNEAALFGRSVSSQYEQRMT